ncbi:hypothetical protein OL239_17500 [Arthrobacter sp. ATA002]|uniref:hypothetical protein n=1 Tax=Arthrobacter sp. ATA002 TaxID=2991715 RepID=UPI0022A7EF4D|nr:hypothetical protein [Arthrobacter sp. ATA002]WAP51557.1 hypothetical protein OL239_17500 [Arthrobacter sp. ATA002]
MDEKRSAAPRRDWSEGVQIRETGGPNPGSGQYSEAEARPGAGGAAGTDSRERRHQQPFRAAWILTGILIGIGLLWLGGALEDPMANSYGMTTFDPETGRQVEPERPPLAIQLRNFGYLAPQMLQTGLASAAALLIIRGVRKSRTLPQPTPRSEL